MKDYFGMDIVENANPAAMILGSYFYDSFSWNEKSQYFRTLSKSFITKDLFNFCIGNINDEDRIKKIHLSLHFGEGKSGAEESDYRYSLEPFSSLPDLLESLHRKIDDCNSGGLFGEPLIVEDVFLDLTPIQQLLFCDFFEFFHSGFYGKNCSSLSPGDNRFISLSFIVDAINILKNEDSDKGCLINDFIRSAFFKSIIYIDDGLSYNNRLIQYFEIEKEYSFICDDDYNVNPERVKSLIKNLCDYYRGYGTYLSKEIEIPSCDDVEEVWEVIREESDFSSYFLSSNKNLMVNELVGIVFDSYSDKCHREWLEKKKKDYNFFLEDTENNLCALSSNISVSHELGNYFRNKLLDSNDVHELAKLSSIYCYSYIPPSLKSAIAHHISVNQSDDLKLFRNNDFYKRSNEDELVTYWALWKKDLRRWDQANRGFFNSFFSVKNKNHFFIFLQFTEVVYNITSDAFDIFHDKSKSEDLENIKEVLGFYYDDEDLVIKILSKIKFCFKESYSYLQFFYKFLESNHANMNELVIGFEGKFQLMLDHGVIVTKMLERNDFGFDVERVVENKLEEKNLFIANEISSNKLLIENSLLAISSRIDDFIAQISLIFEASDKPKWNGISLVLALNFVIILMLILL